jgi:hypothetical protein
MCRHLFIVCVCVCVRGGAGGVGSVAAGVPSELAMTGLKQLNQVV